MDRHGRRWGDRYSPVTVVGRGSSAEVWRAHDHRLHRDVAVKQFLSGVDTEQAARFAREVAVLDRLDHPHVVRIWDAGVDDGLLARMTARDPSQRPDAAHVAVWHTVSPAAADGETWTTLPFAAAASPDARPHVARPSPVPGRTRRSWEFRRASPWPDRRGRRGFTPAVATLAAVAATLLSAVSVAALRTGDTPPPGDAAASLQTSGARPPATGRALPTPSSTAAGVSSVPTVSAQAAHGRSRPAGSGSIPETAARAATGVPAAIGQEDPGAVARRDTADVTGGHSTDGNVGARPRDGRRSDEGRGAPGDHGSRGADTGKGKGSGTAGGAGNGTGST